MDRYEKDKMITKISDLLNKIIYALREENRVYKFKVVRVSLEKKDNDTFKLWILASPEQHFCLGTYYDDIEIDFEDVGVYWFYSLEQAKKMAYRYKYQGKEQLTLF